MTLRVGLTFHITLSLLTLFDTLRPEVSDLHFADDIFKCISSNETYMYYILIQISLMFVANAVIDKESVLVQVMAWRRRGAKPWRQIASLGDGDLKDTYDITYFIFSCYIGFI